MRVLIAEDEFLSRKVLRSLLASLDPEVVVTGKEALDAYRRSLDQGRPFGLILLDIMMPDMDGIGALDAMRRLEEERGLPPCSVIMVSALDDDRIVSVSYDKHKVAGYIVKPLTREKLEAPLAELGISL